MASKSTKLTSNFLDKYSKDEIMWVLYVLIQKRFRKDVAKDKHIGESMGDIYPYFNRHTSKKLADFELFKNKEPIKNIEKLNALVTLAYPNSGETFESFFNKTIYEYRKANKLLDNPIDPYSDYTLSMINSLPEGKQLQDVYVKRKVEGEILEKWERHKLITIVGAGGSGKSSLLYGIYQHFASLNTCDCYILAANTLIQIGTQVLNHFTNVAVATERLGRQQILLLDTLDVLLHRTDSRMEVKKLLRELVMLNNLHVIISCRVEEAQLYLNSNELGAPSRMFSLLGFDEVEDLPQVLQKYASEYLKEGIERARYIDKIVSLVGKKTEMGWQSEVSKLYTQPLTLRMIFEIYSQSDLNEEINLYRLYKDYWERRVLKDIREEKAQNILASDEENLSRAAQTIALRMLCTGSPIIEREILEEILERDNIDRRYLALLTTRGILQTNSIDGTTPGYKEEIVNFFHQTFFEHAAAQAIVKRQKLYEEFQKLLFPNGIGGTEPDFFRLPVMGHVLYLENLTNTDKVIEILDSLFKSSHDYRTIGLRLVPCFSETRKIDLYFNGILLNVGFTDEELKDYLKHIGNTPKQRLGALWKHLNTIWAKGRPTTNISLLSYTKWLALIEPENFVDFVTKHEPEDYLYNYFYNVAQKNKHFDGRDDLEYIATQATHELVYVLEPYFVLLSMPQYYLWALNRILLMIRPRTNAPFIESLLSLLKIYRHKVDFEWFSNKLTPQIETCLTSNTVNTKHNLNMEVVDKLGAIYYEYWLEQGKDPKNIYKQILLSNGYAYAAFLNGLAKLLNHQTEDGNHPYANKDYGHEFLDNLPFLETQNPDRVFFWKPYIALQAKHSRYDFLMGHANRRIENYIRNTFKEFNDEEWSRFNDIMLPFYKLCEKPYSASYYFQTKLIRFLKLDNIYWDKVFSQDRFSTDTVRWIAFCMACNSPGLRERVINECLHKNEGKENEIRQKLLNCLWPYVENAGLYGIWVELAITEKSLKSLHTIAQNITQKHFKKKFSDKPIVFDKSEEGIIEILKQKSHTLQPFVFNMLIDADTTIPVKRDAASLYTGLIIMDVLPYEYGIWRQLIESLKNKGSQSDVLPNLLLLYIFKNLSVDDAEGALKVISLFTESEIPEVRRVALEAYVVQCGNVELPNIDQVKYFSILKELLHISATKGRYISAFISLLERNYLKKYEKTIDFLMTFLKLNELHTISKSKQNDWPHKFVMAVNKIMLKLSLEQKEKLAMQCGTLPFISFMIIVNSLFYNDEFVAGKSKSKIHALFNVNTLDEQKTREIGKKIDRHVVKKEAARWDVADLNL